MTVEQATALSREAWALTQADGASQASSQLVARMQAERLIADAGKVEKTVSPQLQNLAEETGGTIEGFKYRLKGVDSLTRKISDGTSVTEINDALRYTITYPPDELAQGANRTMEQLEKLGYRKVRVKNTFEAGNSYLGINTTWEKDGQLLELQFHTPESFHVKDVVNHKLYEVQRELYTKGPSGDVLKPPAETAQIAAKYEQFIAEEYPDLLPLLQKVKDQTVNADELYKALYQQQKINSSKLTIPADIKDVQIYPS